MNMLHSLQLMVAFFAGASTASAGTSAAVGFAIAALVAAVGCLIVHFNPMKG